MYEACISCKVHENIFKVCIISNKSIQTFLINYFTCICDYGIKAIRN